MNYTIMMAQDAEPECHQIVGKELYISECPSFPPDLEWWCLLFKEMGPLSASTCSSSTCVDYLSTSWSGRSFRPATLPSDWLQKLEEILQWPRSLAVFFLLPAGLAATFLSSEWWCLARSSWMEEEAPLPVEPPAMETWHEKCILMSLWERNERLL